MEVIKLFKIKNNDFDQGFLYDYASSFINGSSLVCKHGIYEYINKEGHVLYFPKMDHNVITSVNDYNYVSKRHTSITTSGHVNKYKFSNNLSLVLVNDKYGYINLSGNMEIAPMYDDARNFSCDLAAVSINGKCGYIDKTGQMIIKPIYDKAMSFSEGLACVSMNNKYAYIDKLGQIVSKNFRYHDYISSIDDLDIEKIDGYYAAFIIDQKIIVLEEDDYEKYLIKMNEIFDELNLEDIKRDNSYSKVKIKK